MTRDLQLIVDQPCAGHFYWTIVELGRRGDEHRIVNYARGPLPTRSSAMVAGLIALAEVQRPADPQVEQMFCGSTSDRTELSRDTLMNA